MKSVIFLLLSLSLLLVSCAEQTATKSLPPPDPVEVTMDIPDKWVAESALLYDNKTSLWTLGDELYSGYAVSFYPDSTLKDRVGILNGKKENQSIQWYPDGHYKQLANYHEGKLHGEKKMWSPGADHTLVAQLNFYSGKAHGEQKKWYPTGELFKKLNLKMGREEGIQQAFRKNGNLFANYEAREGRIFGLKKAALCYGLEDENVQYEN
ncbi:membrane-binding protein [Neolewinella aurantiaca]|uniref:Membrane-binding protein n=1 Tax=Neolewinella aurantiaca TaxID=2602767 RepID=A0A5C7FC85_9BACT|nr:membrane-binding protein [Neolewinella aurantiaca]TXF88550.1 membrane-binding protein [Neolewinella aurantiaca]